MSNAYDAWSEEAREAALEARRGKAKLTSSEKTFLTHYSGDGFSRINSELRSGKADSEAVAHIDNAIAKFTIPSGTALYRGVSIEDLKALAGDEIKLGQILTDKAYLSTSTDPLEARQFGGARIQIKVPEGQHGVDMASVTNNPAEKEFLLPRGLPLRITSIRNPEHVGGPIRIVAEVAKAKDSLRDARRSRDPTKTAGLRRGFRAAGELRLRQLRNVLRRAVCEFDILGLARHPDVMTFHATGTRLGAFGTWIEAEAKQHLASAWPHDWIDKAIKLGEKRALAEMHSKITFAHGTLDNLYTLSAAELKGIAAALAQQVTRAANKSVTQKAAAAVAFRDMALGFPKISQRLQAYTAVMTMLGFNRAKAEVYRANSITKVGVIPETLPKRYADRMRDAKGTFYLVKEEVSVLTMEDDDVCPACEDYADGSPYDIDDIELPLHINCRCCITPSFEQLRETDAWSEEAREFTDTTAEDIQHYSQNAFVQPALLVDGHWIMLNTIVLDAHGAPLRGEHGQFAGSEKGEIEEKAEKGELKFKASANKEEHDARVDQALDAPIPKTSGFVAYRGNLRGLAMEAMNYGDYKVAEQMKLKMAASYFSQAKLYLKQGETEKAAEVYSKAHKMGWTSATKTEPMSVSPLPTTPVPAPPSPTPPSPTAAQELQSAAIAMGAFAVLEATNVSATGFPEPDKLVTAFNAKWGSKAPANVPELHQKVAEYKAMMEQVKSLKAEAKAKHEKALKEKAQQELAKIIGDDPEAKAHFEVLSRIMSGSGGMSGSGNAKYVIETAADRLQDTGIGAATGMTPTEAAMVIAYTASHYEEVNRQLREGVYTEAQYEYATALSKALSKLPDFKGTVYRKANLTAGQAAQYKVGMIVPERAFTSTSKVESTIWSGQYHYEIESKSGKDIARLSREPVENEVLFDRDSHFRVVAKDGYNIKLKEL